MKKRFIPIETWRDDMIGKSVVCVESPSVDNIGYIRPGTCAPILKGGQNKNGVYFWLDLTCGIISYRSGSALRAEGFCMFEDISE